ncbi:antA/AntB antirepressor family protein, partial [Cetobacterium sp.]|uniref:antA/AntB antirepressor family protein n=1 Tax=Cetobacterium sp. TaxID=2071632 RepID=UPI003EE76AB5
IEKYEFKENEDFIQCVEISTGTNDKKYKGKDYLITMDMAKELSMIENNEKGRQARKYFIACEKKYVELLENKLEVLGTKFEIEPIKSNNNEWGVATIKTNLSKAEIIENEIDRLVAELKPLYAEIEKIAYQKGDNFIDTYCLFHNADREKTFCK